jgi:uracil-DNA glycosylase
MIHDQLPQEWKTLLQPEFDKPYYLELLKFLREEYGSVKVHPLPTKIFAAFENTKPQDIKVVMIGQDPYPSDHAHGLAFSSQQARRPASLNTIFKEVDRDLLKTETVEQFKQAFPHNNLTSWRDQGVLLLNAVLTVRDKASNSHAGKGWEDFTKQVIQGLWEEEKPRVYVLWGKFAQELFFSAITNNGEIRPHNGNPLILKAAHPATAAYGKDLFTGCSHFSSINNYLSSQNLTPIKWQLG